MQFGDGLVQGATRLLALAPDADTVGSMGERRVLDALFVVLPLLVAGCGSSAGSTSGQGEGGAEAHYEAGAVGDDGPGSPPPTGDGGVAAACDDFTTALFGCSLATSAEKTREAARYQQFCENQANLPGSTTTVAALEACAEAFKADCNTTACNLPNVGTLPGGAPCNPGFDLQCQSGSCRQTPQADGGYPSCGTCTTTIAVGQPCALTTSDTASCAPGSTCSTTAKVCVKYGAPGDSCTTVGCDGTSSFCASSGVCTSLIASGGACSGDGQCANSFPCVSGKCSPPAAVGAACLPTGYASACARGATCDPTMDKCVVPSVQPGGSCGPGMLCILGDCLSTGTCPTLVPDGQPCPKDGSQVCDVAASCDYTGICEIPGSPVCR